MKKIYFCALILFLIPFSALSAQTMTDEELDSRILEVLGDTEYIKNKVNDFVATSFFANEQVIGDLALDLPSEDRLEILEKNFMDKSSFVFLNLWPGFGVGSFRQKDYASFGLLCGLDVLGYSAMLVGTGWLLVDVFISVFVGALSGGNASSDNQLKALYTGAFITLGAGLGVEIVSKIIGGIFAARYTEKYNLRMQKVLQLDNNNSLAFSPLIDPTENKYGLMASIKL